MVGHGSFLLLSRGSIAEERPDGFPCWPWESPRGLQLRRVRETTAE
ncbi:hypothetical protein MINT15_40280 [Saccharomonospora viridis]|uniref:Uncharacterized protein n=1 Tax=Saccharomonospora viridis TaxID=1852 RepID=A0A837D3T8_9PSEU|nr:hypothetical protein MINT15_40280 [Saccharomonospora viridis]